MRSPRERLIAAVVPLVAEGCEEVTVPAIVAPAGSTTAELSPHFAGAEDCRRAAIESARLETSEPDLVPSAAAEFVVGCFLELAVKCHASGDFKQLEQGLPALLYRVTEAFFGPAAAEEELERLDHRRPPESRS